MNTVHTNCLPMLIGSLPLQNHAQAMETILRYTPEIPLWPQLPCYPEEGMVPQFISGMPGLDYCEGKPFIDGQGEKYDADFLSFYEEYLLCTEGDGDLDGSRFILTEDTAKGFIEFLHQSEQSQETISFLKAQTTGPFTFATGVVDHDNRAIFYNDQMKDAALKLLALKAKYQIKKMKEICPNTIMVFDEPALAGYGSSAFITISQEDISSCFREVFEAVKEEGALAGVHVCANTEWSILFDADADLVSFDAYSYFDKFILYPDHLKKFLNKGGILASGVVPTTKEFLDRENAESITQKWQEQTAELNEIGIPLTTIVQQSVITPSCGTGSLSTEDAERVLQLTNQVSSNIRKHYNLS